MIPSRLSLKFVTNGTKPKHSQDINTVFHPKDCILFRHVGAHSDVRQMGVRGPQYTETAHKGRGFHV